jgi:hypothetical protein
MNQPTYFMAICCITVIFIKIPTTTHQTCNMTGYLGSSMNFNQARTKFCAQMGHQALTTLCISTTDRHETHHIKPWWCRLKVSPECLVTIPFSHGIHLGLHCIVTMKASNPIKHTWIPKKPTSTECFFK